MTYTLVKNGNRVFVSADVPGIGTIKAFSTLKDSEDTICFNCLFGEFLEAIVVEKRFFEDNEGDCVGKVVDGFLQKINDL